MALKRSPRMHSPQFGMLAVTVGMTVALALALLVTNQPAAGHAEPETSNPPAGTTVPEAPDIVTVVFSEEVAAEGTELTVTGPDGNRVDRGDSMLDLYDMERRTVTVGLQPDLGPGTYTVTWRSTSASDDDRDEGSFTFSVGTASTPVASPGASPVASPSASPAASPSTARSSSMVIAGS